MVPLTMSVIVAHIFRVNLTFQVLVHIPPEGPQLPCNSLQTHLIHIARRHLPKGFVSLRQLGPRATKAFVEGNGDRLPNVSPQNADFLAEDVSGLPLGPRLSR